QEWVAAAVTLDDAAYIPLRTDWMPNGTRRTADGVEVLLAGRWPPEVQAAIAAGQFARVSGRIVAEFWKCIAACGLSEESDEKQSEAPAVAPEPLAGVVSSRDFSAEATPDPSGIGRSPPPDTMGGSSDAGPELGCGVGVSAVIESVFPLDQVAKMGAAMALRMLEEYREKYPHLEIPGTDALEMMGREGLVAMLIRAVTDPQVVAEARTQKARLDAALEAQERESRRPKIVLNDKVLNEKTAEAIDALQVMNDPPRLFVRAGRIVRVERDEHGRPVIQSLNKAAVRGELDRAAHWVLFKPDKDKEVIETYVTPGEAIAEDLMERPPGEWGLPALIGIATSPILHLDGTIHDGIGYDSVTRMYLLPEPGFVLAPVPANPTAADIAAAKEMILEIFWDFPFVDEASRWNAVGAFLTGVFRPIIDGPCPCWLLTKPQAGSGASLMQNAVYLAITGVTPPASVTPKTKEEWEKRALSILMGGAPVHIWDNLEGSFRSDVLASLLTAREWRGRRLGQTEEVSVPARTVWFANGNNVAIGGDLARRVYLSRIDAEVALPWMREDFRHPDLLRWIRENRGRLIAAALTLGVAWVQAGCPEPEKVPPLGGYEDWRRVVGGVLEHAGATQFMGNAMEVFLEADTDLRQWEGFLSAVFEVWGSNPWSVADLKARLEGEMSVVTQYPVRINEVLPDDLADAFADPRRSFSRSCGRALARQEGRRFPSGLMIKRGKAVQRATQWVIIQTMTGGDAE
ncbi:MAG TPA: hypothetical protein PKJ67_10975, partial [Methanoculleus sp.]|nr:hypothetical protein [Methanoculleus sp.]